MGRYNSYPRRFGQVEENSICRILSREMANKLSFAYSTDEDGYSFAELYSIAVMFEWANRFTERAVKQATPLTAVDLERWEKLFGIPSHPSISLEQRRNRILARFQACSNTLAEVEEALKTLCGPAFDSIDVNESAFNYWDNVNPCPDSGYPWISSRYVWLIHLIQPQHWSNDDMSNLRANINELMFRIAPIFVTWETSIGAAFVCSIGVVGINPLD